MSGMSFSGLLFIVFLVLKLTGVIAWSWWWVTSPLWISALLWFIAVSLMFASQERAAARRRRYYQRRYDSRR